MRKKQLKRDYHKLIIFWSFILMIIMVTGAVFAAHVNVYATETSSDVTGINNVAEESTNNAAESQSNSETETGSTAETQGNMEGSSETETETQEPIEPNPTGSIKTAQKGAKVNIRSGPGTNYSVVKQVGGDLRVEILETVKVSDYKVWYKVAFYVAGEHYTGYVDGDYVKLDEAIDYSEDMEFEQYLNAQKFPESYRASLRELHKKYPKWIFIADHLDEDFNSFVKLQNTAGRSLISKTQISSWKSTETTTNEDGSWSSSYYNWDNSTWYGWDGGKWAQASKELIMYTLDPRNFLNETNIFMYECLSYDSNIHNEEGVKNIIAGSFMENSTHDLSYDNRKFTYSSAFVYAGQFSQVSPYFIAARIRQEQGKEGQSQSISGTVPGYEGIYNYFNVYASADPNGDPNINGLKYVSQTGSYIRPWNSRMKSIIGGAIYLGSNYISVGQDTLYYQKYDTCNYYGWLHQYMTHVLAPRSESVSASKAYSAEMKASTALVFKIPVYQNMPQEVCAEPKRNGSPNNTLNGLSVDGQELTPHFEKFMHEYSMIVDNGVASIKINADKADSSATLTGDGVVNLNVGHNKIDIVLKAENGDVRTYTINVLRKEPDPTEASTESPTQTPTQPPTEESSEQSTQAPTEPLVVYDFSAYKIDSGKNYIYGFEVGNTVESIRQKVKLSEGLNLKVYGKDGKENTGNIASGNIIKVYKNDGTELVSYSIVIFGDVNGDGAITSMDMLYVKRHILSVKSLEGSCLYAADANRSNGIVSSMDLLYIKRHVLNVKSIIQN